MRETFVQLRGKVRVLRKPGKGWHVGSQGDLCSWSEACGGGRSAVAVQEVGKEDKEKQGCRGLPRE